MRDQPRDPTAMRSTLLPLLGSAEHFSNSIGPRSTCRSRLPYEKKSWFGAEWALPWALDPPTAPTAKTISRVCALITCFASKIYPEDRNEQASVRSALIDFPRHRSGHPLVGILETARAQGVLEPVMSPIL